MTLVSVIIPTHNRSALLKQAIESVLAAEQNDISLEIIIIDDGSTDDTPEVIKNYPVVYVRQNGGLGPSGARNVGVKAAQGDYIAFLDDDDAWLPAKLSAQVRLFQEHPDYGLVLAQMWLCNSNLEDHWGPYPPDMPQSQLSLTDLLQLDPQLGTCMVKREIAQQIPFDRSLRWMEDWDWFLKVAHTAPVGYTNVPVMLFRTRPRKVSERWLLYRGTIKAFRRNTRSFPFSERLKLQRLLWKWRGKYTWEFLEMTGDNVRSGNYRQALLALGYALWVSPAHVALKLTRSVRGKLARLRSAPLPHSAG